ncbi:cytochrome P450, putative [Talaromyces stipitatus ATCC 10500]|uniref:Cytochrome P450, putative n=1 Tax=Talaromyces stipitatus (strain ATCC 10500 / CBS 375.48 / QM 6759 / NRRL 1006) TaxID=441959 RepID=B8MEJ3_TALSN|nr:cytochrome P450, putative [Talaromyces stipitatus ATCC 10500]EED16620.1 cytochrome P450, putative [Talaromyces stipitatus ATCC 10500]
MQLANLVNHNALELLSNRNAVWTLITLLSFVAWIFLGSFGEPTKLSDPVPGVYNTVQFLTNNERFMKRVMNLLSKCNIAKFYLGTVPVYLISGTKNIQSIFGRDNKVGSEDIFVERVLPTLYKMPKKDVEKFANDKSGRGHNPAPGTEDMPQDQRYWAKYEHIHTEYLARTQNLKPIIEAYSNQLMQDLNKYPTDKWTTIGIVEMCRREVTKCAMSTLLGPKVFELNPNFLESFWEFDDNVFMLTLGFPKWLNPGPYKAQDKYLSMIEKYVVAAIENFDWNGPDIESSWEPHFGARICRETAKWFKESGFPDVSISGALGTLLFAQNSNTIPTTMWMLLEILKDSSLLRAVQEEVATTYSKDPETGKPVCDLQKLVMLPLLQSIFTEVLRLHMNFNIIRHTKEPITMDGYKIKKGAMLQVPMMAAHYEESVWGSTGNPASEFWAERHIKYIDDKKENGEIERKRVFAMAGRPSSYFPFGGGPPICPGRHFAKHEILTTIGMLVTKFDIEFVEWVNFDGSPSDRPAQNNQQYCGAGSMPPDREMKIKMKRLW